MLAIVKQSTPHALPLMKSLEVVSVALDAAQHRRERLASLKGATLTPETPELESRVVGKRALKGPGAEPSSASTVASSSMIEKVTPDAKHVRVAPPTPKALFTSPTVGDVQREEGGMIPQIKYHQLYIYICIHAIGYPVKHHTYGRCSN